jgi:membrane protease YdiL (CAAX protease family)
VLLFLLGHSFIGARFHEWPAIFGVHDRTGRYLLQILLAWTTVAFIWWGLIRRGIRLSDLIGGSWARPVYLLRDLGLGIAFILIVGVLGEGLTSLLKVTDPKAVRQMMPQTPSEVVLWILLSLTAGFCEEVIFRGYLQRQFSALTRSFVGGIGLQAIAFGLFHTYLGWKLMLIITAYGACYGLLAHWRRSLRPGMLVHALGDIASGLIFAIIVGSAWP